MKTKEELVAFEDKVVEIFNDGQLKSPVHLSGSTDGSLEDFLINFFKENINSEDWIFSTYRSHYHALLKGISEEWLLNWIKENKSIHVMNIEHKFWTSAIVGGTLPIALGVAKALKLKRDGVLEAQNPHEVQDSKFDSSSRYPHVWVFCGDMTAETGIFHEVYKYAINHDLPITFIIEDNNLSTDTPTSEVWGNKTNWKDKPKVVHFSYTRRFPHYGTGIFVKKIWEGIDETKQKGF